MSENFSRLVAIIGKDAGEIDQKSREAGIVGFANIPTGDEDFGNVSLFLMADGSLCVDTHCEKSTEKGGTLITYNANGAPDTTSPRILGKVERILTIAESKVS